MVEKNMVTLTERTIMKSRSGVYSDTAENRRKHRVGQKYGAEKQSDDGEKTEKKETDPAKELEAVNKVIAAINEGKLNLPAAEVMKLSEKKQKLEAAKKQAEKINAGVKANEEKKNAEEAKETSKKINEAQKEEEKRGYRLDDSAIIKDSNKTKAEKISEIKDKYAKLMKKHADELNRMGIPSGHQLALLQRTRDEKIKEIEAQEELKKEVTNLRDTEKWLQQEIDDITKKIDGITNKTIQISSREKPKVFQRLEKLKSSLKNTQEKLKALGENVDEGAKPVEPKKDIQKQGSEDKSKESETYTRVKFDDVPNSGKINLKKYLSDKVRKGVDEKWSNIRNIPTENLKKMEKGLVNDLNKNFEAIKKSQRAELLYSIMKVKGELESRGKETQKKE